MLQFYVIMIKPSTLIFFCIPVSSGSVTINDDSSVQILAEEAFPVDQLDAQVNLSWMLLEFIDTESIL
jgi:F0F1-type ATP synthase epsilon subunit